MAVKITISNAEFNVVPGIDQVATVKYKKLGDPDSAFITVTTTATINKTTGNFTPNVVIEGLLKGITYIVRVSDNCNDIYVDKNFIIPLPACVDLTDIQGVTSNE